MKRQNILVAFSLLMATLCVPFSVSAQDEEGVTDSHLKQYAMMEEIKDIMVENMKTGLKDLVDQQEGISQARFFNELYRTGGDEAKLKEVEAEDFEKKFLKTAMEYQDKKKKDISKMYSMLATKFMGAKAYKSTKSAVSSDADVQDRYNKIKGKLSGVTMMADGDSSMR